MLKSSEKTWGPAGKRDACLCSAFCEKVMASHMAFPHIHYCPFTLISIVLHGRKLVFTPETRCAIRGQVPRFLCLYWRWNVWLTSSHWFDRLFSFFPIKGKRKWMDTWSIDSMNEHKIRMYSWRGENGKCFITWTSKIFLILSFRLTQINPMQLWTLGR